MNTGTPRTFKRRDGSIGASYEVRAKTLRILTRQDAADGETQARETEIAPVDESLETEEEIPF